MPPAKNIGSPTSAVANAVRKRGGRSNVAVEIPKRRGGSDLDDENLYFRTAASPADAAAGEKPLMAIATGQTRSQLRSSTRQQPTRGKPRRSLPGQGRAAAVETTAPVKTSKATTRVLQAAKEGRLSHISPSDLSTVSTAPPTPASVAAASASETESPMVTQQHDDAPAVEEEEHTTTVAQQGNDADHHRGSEAADIQGSPESLGIHVEPDDQDDELVPPPPPPVTADSQEPFHETEEDFPMFDNDEDDDDRHDSQDDVGLPSEIDAEEKKSDDLNAPSDDEQSPKSALKTPRSAKKHSRTPGNEDDGGIHDNGEHFDGDNEESDGFNMVHDPETPESVREDRVRKEEQALEQKRKRLARTDDLSDVETPAKSTKGRKKKKHRVAFKASPEGYPVGPRDYVTVPVSDLKNSPDKSNCRRSQRAHHKPLAFWKNERAIYAAHDVKGRVGEAMGNMPVVASYVNALPTPRKKKAVPKGKAKGKKGRPSTPTSSRVALDETPFDARKLKRKYNYIDGEDGLVWDDGAKDVKEDKIVSRSRNLERHDLPLPKTRTRAEGKVVARAAQAFNIPANPENEDYVGYIMGHLAIPPKGIKDSESSGRCAHTFTVCHCQPNALEVAYADPDDGEGVFDADNAQRLLLSPGDMFRVPQGNSYRIQNHSTTMDCLLTWTIIKPHTSQN